MFSLTPTFIIEPTKRVRRVGGDKEIPVNCHIVCAMNQDPQECIANGTLKIDLFYRIAVLTIDIPPLRNRPEDIPLLTTFFIKKFNEKFSGSDKYCSNTVMQLFKHHPWPGNVRELQHIVEHAFILLGENENVIRPGHLPLYFLKQKLNRPENNIDPTQENFEIGDYKQARQIALDTFMEQFHHTFITQALDANKGNVSRTAKAINLSRQHLHEIIKKYNLA